MECCGFCRKGRGRKEGENGGKRDPTSQIPPAPISNVSTSRSDDPGVVRPISTSSASILSQHSISSTSSLCEEKGRNLRIFTYDELRVATNNFSRRLNIGEGGFGSVYRGFIEPLNGVGDKIVVAVKKLNQRSLQGHKQWLAEIQYLGVLEHPYLVKLLGYCSDDGERGVQRLLVYEFMSNRSLDVHLFRRANPPLAWNLRLQIVLGAAEGLAYLHEGLAVEVIYRDFKAANILLDQDFRPKLSDFGLARDGPTDGNTHVSTAAVGTEGYADPDYIQTGHLTSKSDVWSFGIVLYEILTGRRSLDPNRPPGEQKLLEWVRQYPANMWSFRAIVDPRLAGNYSLRTALEIAKIANDCVAETGKCRPKMSEVVQRLRRAMKLEPIQEQAPPSGWSRRKALLH